MWIEQKTLDLLKPDSVGVIDRCFTHVINIRMHEKIIAIGTKSMELGPNTICLENRSGFEDLQLMPGERVVADGQVLSFPGVRIFLRQGRVLRLDTVQKKTMNTAGLQILKAHIHSMHSRNSYLYEALFYKEHADIFGKFFSEKLEMLHTLYEKDGTWEQVLGLLGEMTGVGIGMTPSGDDFVAGFLLTLSPYLKAEDSCLQEVVRKAEKNTTGISCDMICNAIEGRARQCEIQFLNDRDNLPEAVRFLKKIVSYGSSSGMDCLIGIYEANCLLNSKMFRKVR